MSFLYEWLCEETHAEPIFSYIQFIAYGSAVSDTFYKRFYWCNSLQHFLSYVTYFFPFSLKNDGSVKHKYSNFRM